QVAEMDPAILLNLIQNYDQYDATAWLHTVHVPTLILSGDQDNIIPLEQQELMHQLIPDSRLEIIKHGSHCPQMDLPDLVNMKIERFLNELNYGALSSLTKETASQSTETRPAPSPPAAS
ncbi:MAG: alpha/beta fold hydrolase, partial [Bdellovibrionota bacterium]